MSEITLVLEAIKRGERLASEQLLPLVYDKLRNLAAARMAQENAGQTLQPTALVHEAWLQLAGDGSRSWQNRAHFFAFPAGFLAFLGAAFFAAAFLGAACAIITPCPLRSGRSSRTILPTCHISSLAISASSWFSFAW